MDMFYDRCRVTQPQQPTNVLIRSLILIASPWQTMRRAIRWKVTEYPMRVEQHLLPRMLTLGFVYSVMIRNYQNFKTFDRSQVSIVRQNSLSTNIVT